MPAKIVKTLSIANARGLHARAAAKFVKIASRYVADVEVVKEGMSASGQSIMELLMLGAAQGSKIDLQATGPERKAALAALETLIVQKFDEE